jgi:hypothetical protein
MYLAEWEIWHTYSTYLKGDVKDLHGVARDFVKSGFAPFAMHRDGTAYWGKDEDVRSGFSVIELNEDETRAKVSLKLPDGSNTIPEGFAGEAWYQSAFMRFNEIRVFGDDISAAPPYIRAFLGQYTLASTTGERPRLIDCYPIVKLYESGVLLLELRIISPEGPVSVNEFIKDYLNIHTALFDDIQVSPALSKLAPRVYLEYTLQKVSIVNRFRLKRISESHNKVIDELTEEVEAGDFTFKAAPLPSVVEGKPERLLSLVQTIFSVVSFLASKRREGRRLLLLGQRQLLDSGDYWRGHPHIHIVRHDEQMETPDRNEKIHGESFGWILSRVSGNCPPDSRRYLPANARLFGDYATYITSQATLWVWAKKGLEAQKDWEDANRGHLIYDHQVQAEMLDYGYMLHRSLAESINRSPSSKRVLKIRKSLLELRGQMRQSSHYGEVADLLNRGWEAMGVPGLREDVAESLAIRTEETKMVEAARNERLTRALTVIFGLLAVPPIATEVVAPIWELLGIWRPTNASTAKLFMILVALFFVSGVIYALSLRISSGIRHRDED